MPSEKPLSIPIRTPQVLIGTMLICMINGNCFSEQCKFLLINNGQFSKYSEPSPISAVLNWLGLKSYQVFNNLNSDAEGKDKSKIDDVLFMFEKHFKPTLSVLQLCYQLGSIYSSQDHTEYISNSVMLQMTEALLIKMK